MSSALASISERLQGRSRSETISRGSVTWYYVDKRKLYDFYQTQLKKNETDSSYQSSNYLVLEWYQSAHDTQKLLTKSLQDELGEEAEFDDERDPKMRHIQRGYNKRVDQYEECLAQLQMDMQKEVDMQVEQLQLVEKVSDDAQEEANDAQRGAISMFNKSKCYESNTQVEASNTSARDVQALLRANQEQQ
jgi:hypothetical protein